MAAVPASYRLHARIAAQATHVRTAAQTVYGTLTGPNGFPKVNFRQTALTVLQNVTTAMGRMQHILHRGCNTYYIDDDLAQG
eukprot:5211031-Amphidinium_carterae.1